MDGVFCRACVFFAPKEVGGQSLGVFVTKPFKSHRDDNITWMEPESHNLGNFVALVRSRAETDPVLAEHLANSP